PIRRHCAGGTDSTGRGGVRLHSGAVLGSRTAPNGEQVGIYEVTCGPVGVRFAPMARESGKLGAVSRAVSTKRVARVALLLSFGAAFGAVACGKSGDDGSSDGGNGDGDGDGDGDGMMGGADTGG